MSKRDITTSVKLDWTTRSYLKLIAQLKCRSVHSLIKEAVMRLIERELTAEFSAFFAAGELPEPYRHLAALTLPVEKGLPRHVQDQIRDGNNRLRVVRGWRGMSLEKLSALLAAIHVRIDAATLEQIEDDRLRPAPGLTAALAKVLNVSVEDLRG